MRWVSFRNNNDFKPANFRRLIRLSKFTGVLFFIGAQPFYVLAEDVALLVSGNIPSYQQTSEGFRKHFGGSFKTYVLTEDEQKNKELLQSIRAQSPKVLTAIGSKAAVEARNSFAGTPLVYCMVVNPKYHGLLNKKNTYGVSFAVDESVLFSKYRALLPHLKRIGIIAKKTKNESWISQISALGKKMGIKIEVQRVDSNSDIPNAMRTFFKKIDAFWMTTDPVVTNKFAFNTISDFCVNNKIPLLVPVKSLVSAGGLLSVSYSPNTIGAEAAALSKNILDNQFPGNRLFQPSQVNIAINLKTAQKIEIKIPDSALKISDQIH